GEGLGVRGIGEAKGELQIGAQVGGVGSGGHALRIVVAPTALAETIGQDQGAKRPEPRPGRAGFRVGANRSRSAASKRGEGLGVRGIGEAKGELQIGAQVGGVGSGGHAL
ncbi:hypothetical protein CTI14_56290, partial [Methylobacterium radiotolerans]